MSEQPLSFQDIILRLQDFWREKGCIIKQPYNVQVGAGTANPATSLRVLGPEPWNVAYIEPSVRPDDGRFGDNPNRLQMHHQLQVILQPDPGNPQELYLESLEAIGISQREHDVRFVEDNWESPALGAWGLGWEVWLDGQEVSQFTYFQQMGATEMNPVAVELTYGLDRLALAIQHKDSVWEMDYGAGVLYDGVNLQSEIEHCEYYFNVADVESLRKVFDMWEGEAKRCVEAELVVPAHDYNLKCSHLFNIMDTRGAIGVTERANYFKRMRELARQVSTLYVEQREKLGHPLIKEEKWTVGSNEPVLTIGGNPAMGEPTEAAPFVFEIGSEELPPHDLMGVLKQLESAVPTLLTEKRLTFDKIDVVGTPRRQTVIVHNLSPRQPDQTIEAKGPPADRAFDADGNPTKAAQGFARGKGIDVAELQVIEEKGGKYVMAVIEEKGESAVSVLSAALPKIIAGLKFGKSMRWNDTGIAYSRPLRWFVALFGQHIIPFSYAGVTSGNLSRGLRPYGSPTIVVEDAAHYAQIMRNNGIILSVDNRRDIIWRQVNELAQEIGGTVPKDMDLLDEVTNLVERPQPFRGQFEERFLQLPAPVLVATMRKHQRYFPVYDNKGDLMPYFIAVRNGDDQHLDIVTDGNEHVLRARFSDADFFYGNDSKKSLEAFRPDLEKLTFQFKLGSMLDKTNRLEKLVPQLGEMLGLNAGEQKTAVRAAGLAKADLASDMVVEMTSLQGTMGASYAQRSGESADVVTAIKEQYGAVSSSKPSMAVAIGDRLDSLVGLFAVGLAPKGSNDPFALRRSAIHIIENLIANETSFDLSQAVRASASSHEVEVTDEVLEKVLGFINGRLEVVLKGKGHTPSVVKAVLGGQSSDPYQASLTADKLSDVIEKSADWEQLLDAYARCVRITRKQTETFDLHPDAFKLAPEQTLLSAYQAAESAQDGSLDKLITNLRNLIPAINGFFDNVLVMDDDMAVRNNRLALLQRIAGLADDIVDLSQMEGF